MELLKLDSTIEGLKLWGEIGANFATIIGAGGIIFLFIQHYHNKDIRNLQLMHRCIDNFRRWSQEKLPEINFFYLELINEELFYFQNNLIQKEVAIEWIEGMLDYICIYAEDGSVLTNYNNQQEIEALKVWNDRKGFFNRICFFIHTDLDKSFVVPDLEAGNHNFKKRELSIQLYKHIKKYKY